MQKHSSHLRSVVAILVVAFWAVNVVRAEDAGPSSDTIRSAVERSLPLLEKRAAGSMAQRKQCFTCHNHGVPLLALAAARERGFGYDAGHFERQIKFTAQFLEKNRQA